MALRGVYYTSIIVDNPVDSESEPGEGSSRGLLRDCENFADGLFSALSESRLT